MSAAVTNCDTPAVTSYDIIRYKDGVTIVVSRMSTNGCIESRSYAVPIELLQPLCGAVTEAMLTQVRKPAVILGYRIKLTKFDIATRYVREDGTGDWTWSPKGPLLSLEDKDRMLEEIKEFRSGFPLEGSGYSPPWAMSDVKVVKVVKR